jgi:hypothetical protein
LGGAAEFRESEDTAAPDATAADAASCDAAADVADSDAPADAAASFAISAFFPQAQQFFSGELYAEPKYMVATALAGFPSTHHDVPPACLAV